MIRFKTRKGLDLPIEGVPKEKIESGASVSKVAVLGSDYIGMKPSMAVKVGDLVKAGQLLFECKKNIGLRFTSPVSGTIESINRGEKRVFESVVIAKSGTGHVAFSSHKGADVASYSGDDIKKLLNESGTWAAIRQRPYEKSAYLASEPKAIFITATDSNPLAPKPFVIIKGRLEDFRLGVAAMAKIAKVFVCQNPGPTLATGDNIETAEFSGPHPSGCVGTHIHFLSPVNADKVVWHIGYQDVLELGALIRTGKLNSERIVSVGGSHMKNPRYIKTERGACISELLSGEVKSGARTISGSVFHGHTASGNFDYLGRFSNQISAIKEDNSRDLLGWHSPGLFRFSIKNIYLSKLIPMMTFPFGTNTNGSLRAMVPVGSFEEVCPLDILPTQLLRSLVSKDTDSAQELGCLELGEEDLALMTFAAPGKVDFGPILRENLTTIEKEG